MDEWLGIRKNQSEKVRHEMDFGPIESVSGGGTISEREEILQDIGRGKYEFIVLPPRDSPRVA